MKWRLDHETRWVPHFPAQVLSAGAAGTRGQGLGPGYSHEFSDQVPGDELDGLWLVLQGQSRESFLNGMLISEQHDGAVALGRGLWVQKDSLEASHLTSCWSVLNFKCGPPLSWGFHPTQWQGRLAGAPAAGPREQPGRRGKWRSALEHGQMCSVLTGSSENKASITCADTPGPIGSGGC